MAEKRSALTSKMEGWKSELCSRRKGNGGWRELDIDIYAYSIGRIGIT